MKEKLDCTGIILAGGKSIRLGYNKAFAMINKQSLIERVIDRLSSISRTILIVTNQDQINLIQVARLKGKIVVDLLPDGGPLAGIYTGLEYSNTYNNLVVACDMPFLNTALLRYLFDLAPNFDAVVPKIGNNIEPLHAMYSKNCISYIKPMLHTGRLQTWKLFNLVNTRYVTKYEMVKYDPLCMSFFNVNTGGNLIVAKMLSK